MTCFCNTSYSFSLKRHALLHGGVRPFSCTTCNKGFYQRVGDNLLLLGICCLQVAWLTHMKSHTSDRLPCPACSKPFLTRYLLNQVSPSTIFHTKNNLFFSILRQRKLAERKYRAKSCQYCQSQHWCQRHFYLKSCSKMYICSETAIKCALSQMC